jgi:U1 small nuclear ribonucleoprotein C
MTRYYCEYCDAYLTHDSATVRRQHISGFKHKANVRNYYLQFMNNNTACGPAQQQQGAQLGPAAGMPTGANQMMPPMGPPMTMGQQQPQQNAMPPPKY